MQERRKSLWVRVGVLTVLAVVAVVAVIRIRNELAHAREVIKQRNEMISWLTDRQIQVDVYPNHRVGNVLSNDTMLWSDMRPLPFFRRELGDKFVFVVLPSNGQLTKDEIRRVYKAFDAFEVVMDNQPW